MENENQALLPSEPTYEGASMQEMIWLLYGPPGIGKSTFVSQCEGALFLSTDPGLRFLKVYKRPIEGWLDFKKVVKALTIDRPKQYKSIVIDTIDPLFLMARKYVLDKRGIEHQSDEPYGKAYDLVTTEFTLEILKLTKLPYGLFFLSHSKDVEVRGRALRTSKVIPSLPSQAYKVVAPLADIIAYYGFGETAADTGDPTRVMHFQPSETLEAKDRTKGGLPESLVIPEEGGYKLVESHLLGEVHDAKAAPSKRRILIKRK